MTTMPAGQLDPLAAQLDSATSNGPSGSTPDGARGGERGERVAAHVGADVNGSVAAPAGQRVDVAARRRRSPS